MFYSSLLPSSRISPGVRVAPYDMACAFVAPWTAFLIRDPGFVPRGDFADTALYCFVAAATAVAMFAWRHIGRGFPQLFAWADALQILRAALGAVAVAAAIMFTFTRLDAVPRSLLALNVLTLALPVLAGRVWSRARARRRHRRDAVDAPATENILIIGANEISLHYLRMLASIGDGHRKAVALLDDDARARGRLVCGLPVIGAPRDIACILDEYRVHGMDVHRLVYTGAAGVAELSTLRELGRVAAERAIKLEVLREQLGMAAMTLPPTLAPPGASAAITARQGDGRRVFFRAKRLIDFAVALTLAALLWPLAVLVALAALFDVGAPVLFWQLRIGRCGRQIRIYKFRTLRAPFDGAGHALPGAARLSRLGGFLRATRLDELPQLYNIVVGDMAIVGPRPLLPQDMPGDPELRLTVRPGLTGWAQVHGGKLVTAEEKNALDQWYVRHASFLLDAQIMARTAWTMLTGDVRHDAALEIALAEQQGRSEASAPATFGFQRATRYDDWPRASRAL